MTTRAPRSNRNGRRHGFDHDAARIFYLGQGATRTYARVAAEYGVTEGAIRKVSNADNWAGDAAVFDRDMAERALRRVRRSREQRVDQMLRILDGLFLDAEMNLERLCTELRVSDLPALMKLAELLEGEATERMDPGEVSALFQGMFVVTSEFVPAELRRDWMARIHAVAGGLLLGAAVEAEAA